MRPAGPFRLAALAALMAWASPVAAQHAPGPDGEVRTLDQERLFQDSRFGQRVAEELDAASRALAAENRRIEAELAEEERELSERRSELKPSEFRELADEFDARVTEIRRTQEEKSRAISRRGEAEQQRFFEAALPILGELLEEHGVAAILDDRAVILSSARFDITDEAIARLDATLGEGEPVDEEELPEMTEDHDGDLDAVEPGDHGAPEGPPLELSIPEADAPETDP